jgi:hypothetical protein
LLQVLRILADPSQKLPHEEKPVVPIVQELLAILLQRNPLDRISSSALVKRLEEDMLTAVVTVNAGPIISEEHIVLPGLGCNTEHKKATAVASLVSDS